MPRRSFSQAAMVILGETQISLWSRLNLQSRSSRQLTPHQEIEEELTTPDIA